VTTLAPLPGRGIEPDGEGDGGSAHHDVVALPDAPAAVPAEAGPATDTVDLTPPRPKARATDSALASWVLGRALALLSEETAERVVMAEVLAEAAGRSRALEGAYGRAVALLSEYPGDPLVHRAVDLLAKALLRSRRPSRTAEEA
jgi:hypothetical protein